MHESSYTGMVLAECNSNCLYLTSMFLALIQDFCLMTPEDSIKLKNRRQLSKGCLGNSLSISCRTCSVCIQVAHFTTHLNNGQFTITLSFFLQSLFTGRYTRMYPGLQFRSLLNLSKALRSKLKYRRTR